MTTQMQMKKTHLQTYEHIHIHDFFNRGQIGRTVLFLSNSLIAEIISPHSLEYRGQIWRTSRKKDMQERGSMMATIFSDS